jgi:hypothetical protein
LKKVPQTYNEEKNKTAFSTNVFDIYMQKTETSSMSFTLYNSKWIKDFNIKSETLKLVQERSENTLEVIDIGNDFLNRTQMSK